MKTLIDTSPEGIPKVKVLLTREARLRNEFAAYQQAPDLRILKSHSRFVAGGGSLRPKVMFIGDVPGIDEARSGTPLMGRRLQFTNNLLRGVDLKQADMYVTHLLKYRPQSGRDPKPLEIEASVECLKREIEILQPSVIITWGRCVLEVFSPGAQLHHAHGKPLSLPTTTPIVPMFSPDAALVNPHVTQLLLKDFQIIRELV